MFDYWLLRYLLILVSACAAVCTVLLLLLALKAPYFRSQRVPFFLMLLNAVSYLVAMASYLLCTDWQDKKQNWLCSLQAILMNSSWLYSFISVTILNLYLYKERPFSRTAVILLAGVGAVLVLGLALAPLYLEGFRIFYLKLYNYTRGLNGPFICIIRQRLYYSLFFLFPSILTNVVNLFLRFLNNTPDPDCSIFMLRVIEYYSIFAWLANNLLRFFNYDQEDKLDEASSILIYASMLMVYLVPSLYFIAVASLLRRLRQDALADDCYSEFE